MLQPKQFNDEEGMASLTRTNDSGGCYGAHETIIRFHPILYVENDRKEHSEELIGLLQRLGYVIYWHTPLYFNQNNFKGRKENVFGTTASFNLVGFAKKCGDDFRQSIAKKFDLRAIGPGVEKTDFGRAIPSMVVN